MCLRDREIVSDRLLDLKNKVFKVIWKREYKNECNNDNKIIQNGSNTQYMEERTVMSIKLKYKKLQE